MNLVKKALLAVFVILIVLASWFNCVRTEQTIMDVEQFFIRTRTIQAAQLAADRAMMLAEQRAYEYADLKEGFKKVFEDLQQQNAQITMEAMLLEQVIYGQNDYIVQLQGVLEQNNIPVPAQPKIQLGPQSCPRPPDANFFNSPKPTSPTRPDPLKSADGLYQRNSTVHDVSGTAESHAA